MLKNKLLKNGLLYTVGGLLLQGVNFFTLPIFTRLLSVENFGMLSVYNTWLGIISVFICIQVYTSIGNAKLNYLKDEFDEYISNILILATLFFLFWLIIVFIYKQKISNFINLPVNVIYYLFVHSFCTTIISIKITLYIYGEKPLKKILTSFINVTLNIFLSIYLIQYYINSEKYMGKIIGGLLSNIIVSIYFYIIILMKPPTLKLKHWKFCISLSLPLVLQGGATVILCSFDRIMLQRFKDFYETGIYGIIYNFGMIISILSGALNQAWLPWYYRNLKKENNILIRMYSKNYLIFFTTICIGFLMIVPEVIKIMVPLKYLNGLNLIPLIVGGYYFSYLCNFSINYKLYQGKTIYIALITLNGAVINYILNLYFIPKYGGIGAALTTLISYLTMFLFHEGLVRIKFKYSILKKREYLLDIFLIVVYSLVYYIYMENMVMRLIFLGIYLVTRGVTFYISYAMDRSKK